MAQLIPATFDRNRVSDNSLTEAGTKLRQTAGVRAGDPTGALQDFSKTVSWFCLTECLHAICSSPTHSMCDHRITGTVDKARYLFHPDSVSTLSLQHVVHHNQVFTGYFPLLAGKVDHGKEPSVLPCCDHIVHLLYHFCWQTSGKKSEQKTQQGVKSRSKLIQPHCSPPKTVIFWESLSKAQQRCCFLQGVSHSFIKVFAF